MGLRHVLLAAGILLLPCVVPNVSACQCRERQPPCAQYQEADAVFVGSVTNVSPLDASRRDAAGAGHETISFGVERAFRGVEGGRVELVNRGTSCDYEFTAGKKYLVYAYRNAATGMLSTYYCSRTGEISKAEADLSYLSKLGAHGSKKLIVGVLADGQKTLSDVRVTAESGGKLYRSVSDRAGWFNLNVPRPGKYKVRIYLPHNVGVGGLSDLLEKISGVVKTGKHYVVEYEAEVRTGGCTFIDVPILIFG